MSSISSLSEQVQSHPIESGAKMATGLVVAKLATNPLGCEALLLGVKRLLPSEVKESLSDNAFIQSILPFLPTSDMAALTGLTATWATNSYSGAAAISLVAALFFTGSVLPEHHMSDRDRAFVEKLSVGLTTFCVARGPLGPSVPILMGLTLTEKVGLTKDFKTLGDKLGFVGKCLAANLTCYLISKGMNNWTAYITVALIVSAVLINSNLSSVAKEGESELKEISQNIKKFAIERSTAAVLQNQNFFDVEKGE